MFLWTCVDVEEIVPPVVEEIGPERDVDDVDEDGEGSKQVGANLQRDQKESLGLVEEVSTCHLQTFTTDLVALSISLSTYFRFVFGINHISYMTSMVVAENLRDSMRFQKISKNYKKHESCVFSCPEQLNR